MKNNVYTLFCNISAVYLHLSIFPPIFSEVPGILIEVSQSLFAVLSVIENINVGAQ